MKAKIKIFLLTLMFMMSIGFISKKTSAQVVSVSFQVFYDELTPYGTWVDNPDYGYVWIPNVAPGFTPYATNGYWVFTDLGWTWVSNYSWGWAPFHYGRWYIDPRYGAIWVPDNEWGPGWVTWRRSGDYYGWAPIGPGVSIETAYSNGYNVPFNQWTFVRNRDFGRRNINNYYVNSSKNVTIINNSTVITNIQIDRSRNVRYNAGPERREVEKQAGRSFNPVLIRESNKPGQSLTNNRLQIYRPPVEKNVASGTRPSPARVESLNNVKTLQQRTNATQLQKTNQQPAQGQRTVQPVNQQPQQRTVQPTKQQPQQPQQRTVQPTKQQPQQPQQRTVQPTKQQPQQPQQRTVQPTK
ncbi:MAG: hypothetical protein M0P47_12780, partial [Bacteroidales bacterium]|nr:hypothetical protein [Bacteroidales bacterium]